MQVRMPDYCTSTSTSTYHFSLVGAKQAKLNCKGKCQAPRSGTRHTTDLPQTYHTHHTYHTYHTYHTRQEAS